MSLKPFEEFLVDRLIQSGDQVRPGCRYIFRSTNIENLRRILSALRAASNKRYVTRSGIELSAIILPHANLVIAGQNATPSPMEGLYSDNFAAWLRDAVAEQVELPAAALLTIHNSQLDTLLSSAEDIGATVWSTQTIRQGLEDLIRPDDPAKTVSQFLLRKICDEAEAEGSSLFSYEPIYRSMAEGSLEFHELRMFKDPSFRLNKNVRQLEQRYTENRRLFEKVASAVEHSPDALAERLADEFRPTFTNERIASQLPLQWHDIELDELLKEKEKSKEESFELRQIRGLVDSDRLVHRHEAETGAKHRRVHVILEREGSQVSECRLEFSSQPQPGQALTGRVAASDVEVRQEGRRSVIVSVATQGVSSFSLKVRSRGDSHWDFFFLVVPRGAFYLTDLENRFLVRSATRDEQGHIELQGTQKTLVINPSAEASLALDSLDKQGADILVGDYHRIDYTELFDLVEVLDFRLLSGSHVLNVRAAGESERVKMRLPVLLDERRSPHLFHDDYAGAWHRNPEGSRVPGMVSLGNREYPVSTDEAWLLNLETRFVAETLLVVDERTGHRHIGVEHGAFGVAYAKLLEYFRESGTLPSLCGWSSTLRALIAGVVDAFREFTRSIQSGERLTESQRDIVLAGAVQTENGQRYFSPFSPLVLAYFAELADQAEQDSQSAHAFFALPTITRSRFTPRGLLPYVRLSSSRFGYVRPLSDVDPMWLAVTDDANSLRSYVPTLTAEKIEQFVKSFGVLFDDLASATLTINSIHNGDNAEIFEGIGRYASRHPESRLRIHLNIIGDTHSLTAFDRFSEMTAADDVRNALAFAGNKDDAGQVAHFFRKHVTFSRVDPVAPRPYAHLTLLKAVSSSTPRSHDIHRQPPSAGAGGLISGETSRVDQGAYVSGVGISEAQERSSRLLGVAAAINRLFFPAVEPHESVSAVGAMALSIEPSMRDDLKAAYGSSIWTTVIDPRVTLAFFETEPDTILIHYSDQYTVSSSYDAITLTTRRDLYGAATGTQSLLAIRELNAFNGEWLLRLITDSASSRKGRRGVIAAYKLFWHVLAETQDTVWVPLSMEEWVRVAGNVGLPKGGDDFARFAAAGALSDDVLFAGFSPRGVELVAFEVKTGSGRPDFAKARAQATNLLSHMLGLLTRTGLAGRVFRSLFVRQVLLHIEKYNLYRIFPTQYFQPIIENSEGWLSGDFDVGRCQGFPSRVVLAHIDENCWQTAVKAEAGVVQIELPGGNLDHLLETPLAAIDLHTFAISRAQLVEAWDASGADTALDDLEQAAEIQATNEAAEDPAQEAPAAAAATPAAAGAATAPQAILHDTQEVRNEKDSSSGGHPTPAIHSMEPRVLGDVERIPAPIVDHPSSGTRSPDDGNADNRGGGATAPAHTAASQGTTTPLTVRFGSEHGTGRPLDWHPTDTTRVFNANTGIIGTMGTGKTQFTKSVITQLRAQQGANVNGEPIGILILDYKADYVKSDFTEATGAKVYSLHHLPINPLALYGDIPMLPMHTASAFRTTLSKAFGLGTKQQNRIKNLVLDCYQAAGIQATDASTWKRQAPTLSDVWHRFNDAEKLEEDSLYAALDSLASFEIFEADSAKTMNLLDVVTGVTVINLSGYDTKIQNLVVAVVLDLLYTQMHQRGSSMLDGQFRQLKNVVLVDEADNFMSQGFESLKKLLKEGREFGVATILSTQELTHFRTAEDDYAKYILTWIVHRVGSIQAADARAIFNVEAKPDVDALLREIRELSKHESLYRDPDKRIRKMRDLAFWELIKNTGDK